MGFFCLVCNVLLQCCNNGSKTKNTIIPETHRVHQIRYFCWETISSRISSYHQSKLDTSVGRLLVPEYLHIISRCFGTNMVYQIYILLKFTVPKQCTCYETEVHIYRAYVSMADIDCCSCCLHLKTFNLFDFPIYCLKKIIPEHLIRYLYFYCK